MAFTPSKPPKPIEIDKFLGINEAVGDTEVKPGEAIYSRNFRVTNNYKLEKRSGHTTFADCGSGKPVRGMWHGTIGGSKKLIVVNNGRVFEF